MDKKDKKSKVRSVEDLTDLELGLCASEKYEKYLKLQEEAVRTQAELRLVNNEMNKRASKKEKADDGNSKD